MINLYPTYDEFLNAHIKYHYHERNYFTYKNMRESVERYRSDPLRLTEVISDFLLIWNQAYHRYGPCNINSFKDCMQKNFESINKYAKRSILEISSSDENSIEKLFTSFYKALWIDTNNTTRGRKSPVEVSKILHALAPKFFPPWDNKIAKAYNCSFGNNPNKKYVSFCKLVKIVADNVKDYDFVRKSEFTIVKLVDEYNYVNCMLVSKK